MINKLFGGGKVATSLTKIGLDAVDSGLEGFVQPGLKMIYKERDSEMSLFSLFKYISTFWTILEVFFCLITTGNTSFQNTFLFLK